MADDLSIDRTVAPHVIPLDDTSWVHWYQGFVRSPHEVFHEVRDQVTWRQSEVLRYDRYVPERRLVGAAPGDGVAVPTVVRHTHLHLRSRFRRPFEGASALLYRTGDDFQGMHSDREMRWLDDTLIAIVVLGVRRPFVLRRRNDPGEDPGDDTVVTPGEGDLLVMGGACQRDWLHGIPRAPTDLPRISLTWRWTSRRGRPDTAPTYFDGRQFSDRPRRPGTRFAP